MGWILAAIHLILFFAAIAAMAPSSRVSADFVQANPGTTSLFAGRPFHFAYEPLIVKVLFLLDFPAQIASIPFALLTIPLVRLLRLDSYQASYISAGLLLLLGTCQWLLLGTWVERSFRSQGIRSSVIR